MHFIEKDCLLQKLKNLIDLASWTDKFHEDANGNLYASNAREIINCILKTYTTIDLSKLAPFAGQRKSGPIQHHIRAPNFRESIVINTVPNFYTRFSGESNSHFTFKNSNAHYKVNFLHIYCHSALVASLSMEFGPRSTCRQEFWAVTTNCTFCTTHILEEPVVFDTSRLAEVSMHELAICQATQHASTVLDDSIKEFLIDQIIPLNAPLVLDNVSATYGILQRMLDITWFSRKKIKDMYGNIRLTDDGHSTLLKLMSKNTNSRINM